MGETKAYRIKRPHYSSGVYYKTGSVVRIPADAKPSKFWLPVTEAEAVAKPFIHMDPSPVSQKDAPKFGGKPSQPVVPGKRPSDRDV